MRLNRFIARCGIASRRKAEELILGGEVCVNGHQVTKLSTTVDIYSDTVTIQGKTIRLPDYKYYMLNKPIGYTVTKSDPHAEKTVFELLPEDPGLIAVGRLDKETEGLLLVTNDGDFAQNIIHPTKKIEKEYEVATRDELQKSDLRKLEQGVMLEDGIATAKEAKILGSKKAIIIIEEGRNRIVRRMFEEIGNKVTGLKRTRIGDIVLNIETGKFRNLKANEVEKYV